MDHRIPKKIIETVYERSLLGWSLRKIAEDLKIASGTVYYLLKEFEGRDQNYYLLRALAVQLKKDGLDVREYAWLGE